MAPIKPGQKIGVMAPSSYVEKDDIEKSAEVLRARGYDVFIHPQTYERHGQSAGDTLQKSLALQGLWLRPDIDAIWFAGGGNQSMPLLSSLNFTSMAKKPKPVIGFSDTTTLINAIHLHTGAVTYHAPVFKQLHTLSDDDLSLTLNGLGDMPPPITFTKDQILKAPDDTTSVTATLAGGNLSVFQYLPTLLGENLYKDKILFLEDCNEELSHIDRIFCFLKQSGALSQVKALLIGQFTNLKDTGRPFGRDLKEILLSHTEECKTPIITHLPFGHASPFAPLSLGNPYTINLENMTLKNA